MEHTHLRALIAVVEEGSFRAAAKRLGISQPSLSQRIGRLEEQSGTDLFDRKPDGAVLTRSGNILYQRACEIIALLDETRELLRAADEDAARGLSIGAIPTIASFVIPRAIRAIRDDMPDVSCVASELTTEDLLDAVASGRIDVGVLASAPDGDRVSLVAEHVGDEPLMLASASGSKWAGKPFLCAEDLEEAGVIILGEMHCLGGQVSEFCASQSVGRVTQIESGQVATLIELVRCDVGISLVPPSMLRGHDLSGITIRDVKDGAPRRPIYTVRRRHQSRSSLAGELSDCIRRIYKQSEFLV